MAKSFQVTIASPDKIVYSGEAISLIVPSELGYLGVLANHAPLFAQLQKGDITLLNNSQRSVFHSEGGGFMEVLNNSVTIVLSKGG